MTDKVTRRQTGLQRHTLLCQSSQRHTWLRPRTCLRTLLLLLAVLTAIGSMASTVKKLDIAVRLHRNGSASIEERWLINLDRSDAKTEWYVAHYGLGDMRIEGLTVKGYVPGREGLAPFETLALWDVNASREAKTGKCGLANGGQEVCWGFGEWGEHEYVVRYELTHLVKSYDTCDGFNHCFVDMDCRIEQARVTIVGTDSIALSEENTRRWTFGYKGRIEFKGDSIVATPNEAVGNGKRIVVMLETDKGVFAPEAKADEPWADRKQRALDGSDYRKSDNEEPGFWEWVLTIGLFIVSAIGYLSMNLLIAMVYWMMWLLLCAVWWVVSLKPLRIWLRRKKYGIKKDRYNRNVKKEWTLINNKMVMNELSYIGGMGNDRIVGAVLLRLMARGDITIVRETYKGKLRDMLRIVEAPSGFPKGEGESALEQEGGRDDDRLCRHALRLLARAAGEDRTLQPDEFKKWCKVKSHTADIKNFLKLLETKYDRQYVRQNAADLYGLKAFLKDFSLLSERSMMEVKLWDEYMVYAEFFGIADKVRAEMAKMCPEYLQMSQLAKSLETAKGNNVVCVFSDSIYKAASNTIERAAERSRSMSGFSTYSSRSGGGGFSGGGGGGGR